MTVATALVAGSDPLPQLAEQAVYEALKKSGLTHANGVLLFLTPDFTRHAQQTVTAVARAAQCTQVAGGIAAGVFTEAGWTLDGPAAAVMVFGRSLSLGHPASGEDSDEAILSYTGGSAPAAWKHGKPRFGGIYKSSTAPADTVVWQQGRLSGETGCNVQLLGAHGTIGVASGLRLLGDPVCIETCSGHELYMLGGDSAQINLVRALPAEYDKQPLPLHELCAVVLDESSNLGCSNAYDAVASGNCRSIGIIAAHPDGSLTLGEHLTVGQRLGWALRQPLAAEAGMKDVLNRLACDAPNPACALMFSCIGRGPYFYGGADRDVEALRERFPELPLIGTYTTGQIAPAGANNNQTLQNTVVTSLVTTLPRLAYVQSIT